MNEQPPTPQHHRPPITDRDEAVRLMEQVYVPHRLDVVGPAPEPLAMQFGGVRLGTLTAGRLTYGPQVRVVTEQLQQFHINANRGGGIRSRHGRSGQVTTAAGSTLVYSPGARGDIEWAPDTTQLCLMVPRAIVETELEALLGHSLTAPLTIDFDAAVEAGQDRRWDAVLDLVDAEIDVAADRGQPGHRPFDRHLEALVVDGLLLHQRHSWSGDLERGRPAAAASIRRAVDLLEQRPGDPWSTTVLAREVHLSVRALQEGFTRDLDTPPMTYLRRIRLRLVHESLRTALPGSTSVRAAASAVGFVHLGRFARVYRETYGESPSATLRRP